MSELKEHFNEAHKHLITHWTYFHVPRRVPGQVNKLIFDKDMVFLLMTYLEETMRTCWTGLFYLQSNEYLKFSYNINLRCEGQNIALPNKTIYPLLKKTYDITKMVPLAIDGILETLGGTDLLCRIELIPDASNVHFQNKTVPELPKPNASPKTKNVDDKILRELECPICCLYMSSPIFICVSGHSLCGKCERLVDKCPQCKKSLLKTRNYALEKLAELVQYPCHNSPFECNFIGTLQELNIHEKQCYTVIKPCPVSKSCQWKGPTETVYSHAKEVHPENCQLELNSRISCFIDLNMTDVQIVQFNGNMFKVCRRQSSPKAPIRWAVKHLDLKRDERSKFKFILDFIDQTKMGRKLVLDDFCCAIKDFDEDDFCYYLQLPHHLLRPFVYNERVLNFTIGFEQLVAV